MGVAGEPDIDACLRGRSLQLEVKRPGERATPLQEKRLAEWRAGEGGYAFDVIADHFLYHMVRKLVGTAFEAAVTADPAGHVAGVLHSRDRRRAGRMVPASGLSLEQVYYEGEAYAS